MTHKVLLPGVTVLERFIAQLRSRVEERLWYTLGRNVTEEQRQHLQDLLLVAEGNRSSQLDQLRSGPVMVAPCIFKWRTSPLFQGLGRRLRRTLSAPVKAGGG